MDLVGGNKRRLPELLIVRRTDSQAPRKSSTFRRHAKRGAAGRAIAEVEQNRLCSPKREAELFTAGGRIGVESE